MRTRRFGILAALIATALPCVAQRPTPPADGIYARENLVAWCVVPFDARKRGPEARAEMLTRLGLFKLAYDWRDEHIASFDEEMETLKRWGIELTAFWFPSSMNETSRTILDLLERHDIQTELWVMGIGGDIDCTPEEHAQRVAANVDHLQPVVEAAAEIGCTVGLYNHGGWFGEPENQIEIVKALDAANVGMVYNLHHGHGHLDRFPELLEKMKPYLLCLNLNGMTKDGDKQGTKILPIGSGGYDLKLLRIIRDSGYDGPIGVLGHTQDDAEHTVHDNLDGLDWLASQLDAEKPSGERPLLRIPRDGAADSSAALCTELEDPIRRAALPLFQTYPAARTEELTASVPAPTHYGNTWQRSHGDAHNTRFSNATQISKDNVHQLVRAWEYRSDDGPGNVQCNPIVVGDTLYAPSSGQHIVAIDATTGEERWRFKPEGRPAFRGLLHWEDVNGDSGRVLFNAGKKLWALDPETGRPILAFGAEGSIETGEVRVPGAVFEDVLVLPTYAGPIAGYNVRTGDRLWIFNTIPQKGEFGHDTWENPEQGANCWGGMALDETRGIAYVSTGSPKPNFAGNTHRGQNLFANCVIGLNAKTGERLWHFQEIHHDIWDLDIPAPPNLTTVVRDGKRVDVVAQVTKMGNTLVLDRVTGAPLYPFRLRRAPVSRLPGERTWPYQPDLALPEPFARQVFSRDHVTDRSPEARDYVLKFIENARFGWFEPFEESKQTVFYGIHGGAEWSGAAVDSDRNRLYVSANNVPWAVTVLRLDPVRRDPNAPPTRGQEVYAANCLECHGPTRLGQGMYPPLHRLAERTDDAAVYELLKSGRNAMPQIAETVTQDDIDALLDYLFLRDIPEEARIEEPEDAPTQYTFGGYPKLLDEEGYPGVKPPWGTLNCLDLNSGKLLWQAPLGHYPDLAAWGEDDTGAENFGGPSATAGGLVFCAGTPDNRIRAFDADTGEVLWSGELPFGGYAPPTIYTVNGKQYIVVAATGGGKLGTETGDAYMAFSLPDA